MKTEGVDMKTKEIISVLCIEQITQEKTVWSPEDVQDIKDPHCSRHEWVNGKLFIRWKTVDFHEFIGLVSGKTEGYLTDGYATIRYCRWCKKLDCFHIFDVREDAPLPALYRVDSGENYYLYHVARCVMCGLYIIQDVQFVRPNAGMSHSLVQRVLEKKELI